MINEESKKIAVIGGGIAGMQSASVLGRLGYQVTIFEKSERLGGNVANWNHLFPHNENATDMISALNTTLESQSNISIAPSTTVLNIANKQNSVSITTPEREYSFDAAIIASGFTPFDATKKEEYGYGIYNHVITSVELEKVEKQNQLSRYVHGKSGKVGFVHCVGSRDEKVCNGYCSKVCCITAIKQAIEVKKQHPNLDVYCFYMDLRLFDRHFESIYREAQEKWGILFIRGRMSEVNEDIKGKLIVRIEDTLSRRPMKLSLDLLVLMVGMVPSEDTQRFASQLSTKSEEDRFIIDNNQILVEQNTGISKGIFAAGTAKSPLTVKETLADAKSVALNVHFYLNQTNL
ncbi:FAD-dependent oxidoreductase [Acetobacteroides hydrogenigenes]|uniref:Heterodisulfide reductase subunit A n=1 Tax=Acetobacteroides hydrogenigenes TaxID=979970 RepID=A0A4R2ESX1_9BACT|nr:FAD-dependent oxidoreductase [Acetobacteroides hydrogenigenes]TCN70552.1 heterodisulfide reductase subunit A [Acetobacteroides hydrogenigenes]